MKHFIFIPLFSILFFLAINASSSTKIRKESKFWGHDGFINQNKVDRLAPKKEIEKKPDITLDKSSFLAPEDLIYNIPNKKETQLMKLKRPELLEKIEELKSQVFNLKSRLFLLKEATVKASFNPSFLSIVQKDNVSHILRGESLIVLLDDKPIHSEVYIDRNLPKEMTLYDKTLEPGLHQIKLNIQYTGKGSGIYSYMKDYVFSLKTKKQVWVKEGYKTILNISINDSGGWLSNIKAKPKIDFDIKYKEI